MGNNMNKQFLEAIHQAHYNEAKKLISIMPYDQRYQFLIDQAIETGSIAIYTFVCFLLSEQESTGLHHCAAGILNHGLCYLKGATSASLLHAKRAAEISPNDITCQQELLSYFGMPEQVMTKDEARNIAKNILSKDSNNPEALNILKKTI